MTTKTPEPLTILLLSDVHFGDQSAHEDFALPGKPPRGVMSGAVPMKRSLVEVASDEKVHLILASGDLTSKASPVEFLGSVRAVNDIAAELHLPPGRVVYTYGNHDVDWSIARIPEGSSSPELKRLYRQVAASSGDIVLPSAGRHTSGPVPGCGVVEGDTFSVYFVNSGYYCAHDQDFPHGKLGQEQLEWLEGKLCPPLPAEKWHVLLLHHHPFPYTYPIPVPDISCLEEGPQLVDLIGKSRIDLVCHGHRHHPMLFTEMRDGWSSPVTFLCAGSLAVNEQERCQGQIPNLFHIIRLESRLVNQAAIGQLRSYEYSNAEGWEPVHYRSRVPLDAVQWFAGVHDDEERETDLSAVLASALGDGTERTVELPNHADLPYSLRCMHLDHLNEMVKTAVSDIPGDYRMIGKFPDEVMVVRKDNAAETE